MILETEIAEFERRSDELLAHHNGKYVVFYGHEMVGAYETLDDAACQAADKYDRGPYLIRQVGAPGVRLQPGLPLRAMVPVAGH